MPRIERIVIPQMPHHITQRGNNRQDVFFVDDDRRVYLEILREQTEKHSLDIQGFCLMTNHIHLIATPAAEDSLARAVGRTHFLYTQYINRMHRRSGHLWQNRFYSCPLDRRHFFQALRYIECNPVRARLHRLPWKYQWSSAAAHIDAYDPTGILNLQQWNQFSHGLNWQKILQEYQPDEEIKRLRLNTHRGRPLAGDSLISKLETKLGRRLRPLPVGRPKKKHDSS
ncbi:MAG: transposase [Sedimentisphaerales bacterium]|nr:transposase [Sedimentisphaerales bacterium]